MNNVDWKNISGTAYDWKTTLKPERPYIHDYTKTLTYKLYLASVNETLDGTDVITTFEKALEQIIAIDKMTEGMPKIVYLVGWQFFGHDSKYPAWNCVNEALKRKQDKTAYDSLLWIMNEGYKYNTTVSLHINIKDAYMDSPLWKEYEENDLLSKEENGSFTKGGYWGNQQSYIVSYKKEWDTGFLKKRIDELCEFLPIQKAGTIHIDAMDARHDPGHGFTLEMGQESRNKIVRYWRELGIDVTSEFLYYETPDWRERVEQLVGLMPLAYVFSQNLEDYIARPASLICGVKSSKRFKEGISDQMGNLFGQSFLVQNICMKKELRDTAWKDVFFRGFCLNEVRYKYLNTLERTHAVVTKDTIEAHFSDGVVTYLNGDIVKNGIFVQTSDFIAIPAVYRNSKSYFVYGINHGEYEIDMGKAYGLEKDMRLKFYDYNTDGISNTYTCESLNDGKLKIHLEENQAYLIEIAE